MQSFAIVHPIIEMEQTIILEFIDETEPIESRRYRLFLQKKSLQEIKLIVYRPKRDLWQDITTMLSPFYLASLRNILLDQIDINPEKENAIS
ncbi:hypothetical protein [Sutcliffiella halmapala]|uniref:hypothetical protein n=1 Tax=Sutcliffiella halmapala TaxID=79882 RepID=UPI0009951B72|nr:hypothetical protein [Sutcliffiella halmapala]